MDATTPGAPAQTLLARRRTAIGAAAGLGAFLLWGFAPVYFKAIGHLSALEILAHRVIWTLAILIILVAALGRLREVILSLTSRRRLRILLITTLSLGLSVTPVSKLPNATALGTAMIYVFVAGMGARASVEGFGQAPAFLLGALIWISIHGAFCLAGAKLFRVDVHSVAIASAANIGAAASAPIVAAFHRPSLVPVSVLMALIGYALGNYLAPLAAHLARIAVGQ